VTCRAASPLGLPLVGAKIFLATIGSANPKGIYKSRSDRHPRRVPGWQAILFSPKKISQCGIRGTDSRASLRG
jgi:hypothetical protein